MKKRLNEIFNFVLENGPTIITIAVAAYILIISEADSVSAETKLQFILAILGLLAISELIMRIRKMQRIEDYASKTYQAIQNRMGERASADGFFFKKLPSLESHFLNAMKIDLYGVSLQHTIRDNIELLAQRLSQGASIRVIILDPEFSISEDITNSDENFIPGKLKLNINATIENLKWLNIQHGSKGTVKAKVVTKSPFFNIIAADTDKEFGSIYIELFPQRWVTSVRPRFELLPNRDAYWFQFYKDQFEEIWKSARPIDLHENEKSKNKH